MGRTSRTNYVVIMRLEEAGFQLNIGKCRSFINKINVLGFGISDKGVEMIPDKIKMIIKWKIPNNLIGIPYLLKSFLGV